MQVLPITTEVLHCEMDRDCASDVTHIGSKGYLYCANHAPDRRPGEGCRALKGWEIALLESGQPVPSYKPISFKTYLITKNKRNLDGYNLS